METEKITVIVWNICKHRKKFIFENICSNPALIPNSYYKFPRILSINIIKNLTNTNILSRGDASCRKSYQKYCQMVWTMD